LKPAERARHLALLGVKSLEALGARLSPRMTLQHGDTAWIVAIEQPSFDGKTHLWLSLQGDTRETVPALSGSVVTIRRPAGSAVRKLSPDGDVSHEEALGGQAIRENAAEYNRLVSAGQLARARALLGDLQATRENYIMVDDDFQLPVVAARYLADPRVPADRK